MDMSTAITNLKKFVTLENTFSTSLPPYFTNKEYEIFRSIDSDKYSVHSLSTLHNYDIAKVVRTEKITRSTNRYFFGTEKYQIPKYVVESMDSRAVAKLVNAGALSIENEVFEYGKRNIYTIDIVALKRQIKFLKDCICETINTELNFHNYKVSALNQLKQEIEKM